MPHPPKWAQTQQMRTRMLNKRSWSLVPWPDRCNHRLHVTTFPSISSCRFSLRVVKSLHFRWRTGDEFPYVYVKLQESQRVCYLWLMSPCCHHTSLILQCPVLLSVESLQSSSAFRVGLGARATRLTWPGYGMVSRMRYELTADLDRFGNVEC